MKTTFTISIILISVQIGFAQGNKLKLSFGAGIANANSENKDMGMGNGLNLQAEAYVPFYNKGSNFALGLNVLGNYATLKNPSPDNALISGQYQIYNGNLSVSSQKGTASASFSGMLGVQASISFGKINFSPSINSGYLRVKQNGFVQTGSANVNGQNQQLALIKSEPQSNSGLAFKPQLKIGYALNSNLSLFVSPAMWIGPEINHVISQRVPQGGFNDKKMYEVSQLANGTWENKTNTTRYNFTELNFGLSIGLGKKKAKATASTFGSGGGATSASYAAGRSVSTNNGETTKPDTATVNQRLSMTPTTNKQTQGQNFGEKVASGLQSGAGALSQGASLIGGAMPKGSAVVPQKNEAQDFNTTRSNRDNRLLSNPDTVITQTNSENQPALKSINSLNNSMPSRLSMTPTTNKQTQGQNFGEKVASGLQSGGNAVGQGASLLGGVLPHGKSISEKGLKRNEAAMARPGTPIGGIVVKGGKNPGGNMNLVSNNNGEILLDNLEIGNYSFQINLPEQPQGKSISQKGVKRNEATEMAKPGQPIGGIIVKGGKNPGGNYIVLAVEENGKVDFEVSEQGNYKLVVEEAAPQAGKSINEKGVKGSAARRRVEVLKSNKTGAPSAIAKEKRTYTGGRKNEPQSKSISEQGVAGPKTKAKQKAKVKEKATSGLKDVLKTNV